MFIINDLFIGWRDGTLGRARFLVSMLVVIALTVASLWAAYNMPYTEHPLSLQCFFWLMLLSSYYCGFLTTVKRFRELVTYPVIWTLVWWISALFVQYYPWSGEMQYVQMVGWIACMLVLGMLFCARARH